MSEISEVFAADPAKVFAWENAVPGVSSYSLN